MGDDPVPCYHHPPKTSMFQLPHLSAPPIIGHSPINNSLSTDSGVVDLASLQNGQFSQSNGWFYCLPRFRQAFLPLGLSYPSPREKQLPAPAYGNNDNAAAASTTVNPPRSSGDSQKKLVVIDQSGDQTTLMVSSGIGTPFQCLTSWSSRHLNFPDMNDQVDENDGCDSKSEMHEDPDELDALLYSSSDEDGFCSEDDEVTSTGHSPSTMTTHERLRSEESIMDEVAWPIRKRKQLPAEGEPFEEEEDTASSGKAMDIHTEYCLHDNSSDAQSSYGNGNMGSDSKRTRREKIRETVSILQDMIPGGSGKGKKDAVVILDEAIQYLKSLKANAGALGLCPL